MVVVKYNQKGIKQNIGTEVLNNLKCEECRCIVRTEDIYCCNFATNKNNGKNILLCGDCARELNDSLNYTINSDVSSLSDVMTEQKLDFYINEISKYLEKANSCPSNLMSKKQGQVINELSKIIREYK